MSKEYMKCSIREEKDPPEVVKSKGWLRNCLKVIAILVGFSMVVVGTYIEVNLWCTDKFDRYILESLQVIEQSEVFDIWRKPEAYNLVHVYPFNYTNVQQAMQGLEKWKVEELGPYTYKETTEKTNITFEGIDSVTFTEYRTHTYLPEISNGSLDDIVISPNVPVIAAISKSIDATWLNQIGIELIFKSISTTPFVSVNMEEFIMGSEGDKFSKFISKLSLLLNEEVPSRFGVLTSRTGLGVDRLTIGTGVPDVNDLGIIRKYNNESKMEVWYEDSCNNLTAADGSLFPGRIVNSEETVYIYTKSLCRRIPLHYQKDVTTPEGLPTKRFMLPENVFANGSVNPDNACFCQYNCPPSGTFSIKPCNFDAPVVLSYPHFLYGDSSLFEKIDGLNPNPEKHRFYLDIHSTLGLPIAGHSRFQIGIMVEHGPFFHELNLIEKGMILPIAWVDIEVGELSGDIKKKVVKGTNEPPNLKLGLTISAAMGPIFGLAIICFLCLWRR